MDKRNGNGAEDAECDERLPKSLEVLGPIRVEIVYKFRV